MGSYRVTHMGTSLTPDFENGHSATSGCRSAEGLDRVCVVKELSGELGIKDAASRL